MARGKMRTEQHLIDERGEALLRASLPEHWVLRPYRPDYGLDFALEVFKPREADEDGPEGSETLGEHIFIQLKSISEGETKPLALFARGNVEKAAEALSKEKIAEVGTYRFSLETTELVTVERMGIGVPVLLVIADLAADRCCFVCLNDYIDKILIPRHGDYTDKASRTIHVLASNQINTEKGEAALRWYAKRPKLLAAFQRFAYQNHELRHRDNGDWRPLAELFAQRIARYDFWNDIDMCRPIGVIGEALARFIDTGQPGLMNVNVAALPEGFDQEEVRTWMLEQDVFELWRRLAWLPQIYEDVWREWFLPTGLGHLASEFPEAAAEAEA